MRFPSFKNELACIKQGYLPAGCDEVGRGPIAGPVVAAVCILDSKSIGKARTKNKWYYRVRDSKTTSEEEREVLLEKILTNCIAYGVGEVWQAEVDAINIHNASLRAMNLAVRDMMRKIKNIKGKEVFLFVDGKFDIPKIKFQQKSVVGGDGSHLSIAAASIIAKVHRDKIMDRFHAQFPQYDFIGNKGYGTPRHLKAVKKYGISTAHRKSFLKG